MTNFITGVLVQNKDGATYEDVVYDRRLKLHLPNDRELSIFDLADPISTELHVGEVYRVVLVPFVVSVNIIQASSTLVGNEPITESNGWQGIVVDPSWEAPKDAFRLVRAELYEQRWVLVTTPVGDLLLNPRNVETTLSRDAVIQWGNTRLDLYAVV